MIINKAKLVRDGILDEIAGRNRTAVVAGPVDDELFDKLLREKLVEEAAEVRDAKTTAELLEELGDLQSVISEIVKLHRLTILDTYDAMKQKTSRKGAFSKRVYLICSTGEAPSNVERFSMPEQAREPSPSAPTPSQTESEVG